MKYLIYEHDHQERKFHAYDFVIETKEKSTIFLLFFSDSPPWSEHIRGQLCLKIKDNGNGLKIVDGKKNLDYSEAQELRLALNCISIYGSEKSNTRMEQYTIVKEETIATL